MSTRPWKLAPALQRLLDQLDFAYPKRSTKHDGDIGDAAHAARKSDHNPNKHGFVNAIDITHDPKSGPDCDQLAMLLQRSRDPRISYVIWKRRIMRSYPKLDAPMSWEWYPYNGENPHDKHLHVSVLSDQRDWTI